MAYEDVDSPLGEELDLLAARMRTESVRMVFNHWRVVKGSRLMPTRRDIDPTEIGSALPRVWLCDYEREVDRFRYRLTGEKVANRFAHRLSKNYLDEKTDPDYYPRVHRYYRNVVDWPAVLFIHGRLYAETANPIHGERILLPLSEDGVTTSAVIGVTAEVLSARDTARQHIPEFQKHIYVLLESGTQLEESLPV